MRHPLDLLEQDARRDYEAEGFGIFPGWTKTRREYLPPKDITIFVGYASILDGSKMLAWDVSASGRPEFYDRERDARDGTLWRQLLRMIRGRA